jgi:hypothetical protein
MMLLHCRSGDFEGLRRKIHFYPSASCLQPAGVPRRLEYAGRHSSKSNGKIDRKAPTICPPNVIFCINSNMKRYQKHNSKIADRGSECERRLKICRSYVCHICSYSSVSISKHAEGNGNPSLAEDIFSSSPSTIWDDS